MPCSGPRMRPLARSASARRAWSSAASGVVRMKACTRQSTSSMRSSSARTTSTGDSSPLRKRRPASAMPSQAGSKLPGPLPALLRDVEDDAVGILELALEVLLLGVVAEVEEELAAERLDPFLRFRQVVDLEAEVVRADVALGVVEARAALAEVVQQGEIDHAVAEVDGGGEVERLLADALQAEHALVEPGRLLQVADHHREMPESRCHAYLLSMPICRRMPRTRA